MVNTQPNNASYWREFENNQVTHSAAHYLMAIDALHGELGYARATDVADRLEVTRAAASAALTQLKKRELVTEDPNRFLLLTDEGRRVVDQVEQNFRTLSRFFEEMLGVSPETSRADACKIEHLMSPETSQKLLKLVKFLLGDSGRAMLIRDSLAYLDETTGDPQHD